MARQSYTFLPKMSLSIDIDRFDFCEGSFLFYSEYHGGQSSTFYQRMCRLLNTFQFKPAPGLCWETMTESARDVYRAFCTKYDKPCEYDHVDYIIKEHTDYDENDACVQYFMEYCEKETIEESSLINFNHGDFVNICMPYTRDLINFYDENEEELLIYVDQYCEAAGYTSRLQLCEGDNIEDPDDFKAALVNHGMTFLGGMLLQSCLEAYD